MLLPYSKEKLWIIIFAWKWVKSIVIYAAAALLIGVMTPISASVIIAYVVLIAAYDLLMAVPQWKLFSQSWQIKLGFLFAAIAVNAAAGLFTQPYIAAGLVFAIFLIAVLVIQNMFRGIQWQKVTDASDFQIWRMPLIGYAAKTKFKRRRNHSMFPGHSRRKNLLFLIRPFFTGCGGSISEKYGICCSDNWCTSSDAYLAHGSA